MAINRNSKLRDVLQVPEAVAVIEITQFFSGINTFSMGIYDFIKWCMILIHCLFTGLIK